MDDKVTELMKKSLLIIMSVAVLGGLGLYINKDNSSKSVSSNTAVVSSTAAAKTNSSSQQSVSTNTGTSSSSTTSTNAYKDGTYSGTEADTLYGTVQVASVISGGKITDIQFLRMPNDQQNSKAVTAMAEPQLKQETLKAQSAHIDFVSGATQTSEGYQQSLQAALDKAAA